MRILRPALLLLPLLVALAPPPASASFHNVLVNPSFETDADGDRLAGGRRTTSPPRASPASPATERTRWT